jgi:hypothetical protein
MINALAMVRMSALGQERPFLSGQPNVRFAPKAVIQAWGN